MSVEAITIFTFWAALFTALSVENLIFNGQDTTNSHLDRRFKSIGVKKRDRISVKDTASEAVPAIKDIREWLIHAGLRRQSDLEKFLLFQRICYMLPLFVLSGFVFFLHIPFFSALFAAVISGIFFVLIPRLWLLSAIVKRRKEIKKHLPDTLDLFVVALEAGLSFDSALVRVAEEQRRVSTHISREFLFANQQILVGKSREEALNAMAHRTGVDEVENLVRAVIQSNRLATSLVKTLRVQAETLRKRRRQEIHAQILKAPVKLIFPLLFCIFPTLVMVILAPSMVEIFRQLTRHAGGAG